MRTNEQLIDALYKLTDNEKQTFESLISAIKGIRDNGKVTEENINLLVNVIRELDIIKDNLFRRLIMSLKRGDKRD